MGPDGPSVRSASSFVFRRFQDTALTAHWGLTTWGVLTIFRGDFPPARWKRLARRKTVWDCDPGRVIFFGGFVCGRLS